MANQQQLYQEFLERKQTNQHKSNLRALEELLSDHQKRQLLEKMDDMDDDEVINLESSILLLNHMGLFRKLKNYQQMMMMMQSRRSGNSMLLKQKMQEAEQESKFICDLWLLINEQQIQLKEMKKIIKLLIKNTSNPLDALTQYYDYTEIVEHLATSWRNLIQHYLQANYQQNQYQQSNTSNYQINEISLIQYQKVSKLSEQKGHQNNKENWKNHANIQRKYHKNEVNNKQKINTKIQTEIRKRTNSIEKYVKKQQNHRVLCNYLNNNNLKRENQFMKNVRINPEPLTCQKEAELIERLYTMDNYKNRGELKRELDERRRDEELSECTFKPCIEHKVKSRSNSVNNLHGMKTIKGYDKTIERMKIAQLRQKELKQFLGFRNQNISSKKYTSIKNMKLNPPKFHLREPEEYLFQLSFLIGKYQVAVKIKETDSIENIALRICKIYSLKEDSKAEIKNIIQLELDKYYEEEYSKQHGQNSMNL